MKRDNFKCTECGEKHGLEAHHSKKSVRECIEEKNIDYIFDIENGIALCSECHKLTETWGPQNKILNLILHLNVILKKEPEQANNGLSLVVLL